MQDFDFVQFAQI